MVHGQVLSGSILMGSPVLRIKINPDGSYFAGPFSLEHIPPIILIYGMLSKVLRLSRLVVWLFFSSDTGWYDSIIFYGREMRDDTIIPSKLL